MGENYFNAAAATSNYAAQSAEAGTAMALFAGAFLLLVFVMLFILLIPVVIGRWKLLSKAGEPGWFAIVPFLGQWKLAEVVGLPGWISLLSLGSFIPGIGWAISFASFVIISMKIPKAYGKKTSYAIGLILLPPIFYLMLGFGKSKYVGSRFDGDLKKAFTFNDFDDKNTLNTNV